MSCMWGLLWLPPPCQAQPHHRDNEFPYSIVPYCIGWVQGTRHAEFVAIDDILAQAGGDTGAARFSE